MSKKVFLILLLFLIISSSLRIIFTKKHYSGDLEPVELIIEKGELPNVNDCSRCNTTKLFFVFSAFLLKILNLKDIYVKVFILTLLCLIAYFITLFFIWKFLSKLKIDYGIKLICLGMIALNPIYVGKIYEGGNDHFSILFSTLTIYFLYSYLESGRHFKKVIIFSILAVLSKDTALLLFPVIVLVLLVKLWLDTKKKRLKTRNTLFLFLLIYLLIVPFFGQFIYKYKNYKDPFFLGIPKVGDPLPLFKNLSYNDIHIIKINNLSSENIVIHSISSAYFTFYINDLLTGHLSYKDTFSFWTQLYLRTHTSVYGYYTTAIDFEFKKVVLVLALLPTLIFMFGFAINIMKMIKGFSKKDYYFYTYDWIFLIFSITYILFLILHSYMFRSEDMINVKYLFPAIIAFLKIFTDGLRAIWEKLKRRKVIKVFFYLLFGALFLGYFLIIIIDPYTLPYNEAPFICGYINDTSLMSTYYQMGFYNFFNDYYKKVDLSYAITGALEECLSQNLPQAKNPCLLFLVNYLFYEPTPWDNQRVLTSFNICDNYVIDQKDDCLINLINRRFNKSITTVSPQECDLFAKEIKNVCLESVNSLPRHTLFVQVTD